MAKNLNKRNLQWHHQKIKSPFVIGAGILSLAFYLLLAFSPGQKTIRFSKEMLQAAQIMAEAIAITSKQARSIGVLDDQLDPNHTGLIGPEHSALATTLGHVEAKRTSTNPDMAALLVHLLQKAGIVAGDAIAIGSSASFPALFIASMSAAKAMALNPIVIFSLGSSSYGATHLDFTLLQVYELLKKEGVFTIPAAAISLGGDRDMGLDFGSGAREKLVEAITSGGYPLVQQPELRRNVAVRLGIYRRQAGEKELSAFINCGGSYANIGTSSMVLRVKPGLNHNLALPEVNTRGMIFEMSDLGIPCIHLLYMKGLAMQYNLPWDPIPLPLPGETPLKDQSGRRGFKSWTITMIYLTGLFLLLLLGGKKANKT